MELLTRVMPPPPSCCHLLTSSLSPSSPSVSASTASFSSSSYYDMSDSSSSSPDPPMYVPTSSSSLSLSPHLPGPSCPAHCHSHSWQPPSASLSSSPSSSSSVHSAHSTASSLSNHSSASLQPVTAAVELHFPTYHSIYPASSLPELYDAHTVTAIFKQDGFTEIYQWQDGPSTAYDTHTHPTHNAHYIFRGDLHVFYPQLNQSVYYRQGDRFDIPAELVHSTSMGQQGCVYMVASKRPEQRR